MMLQTVNLPIIGYVHSPLKQKFGIPRQPNLVNIPAYIEFLPPFNDIKAFDGLQNFSHIWVLWQFHQNKDSHNSNFRPQVRPPRLGGNEKMGIFATRSMYRPANIGLSVVQLQQIETHQSNLHLHILGADMVDGTPVLDIKPYLIYSDNIAHATNNFAKTKPENKTVKINDVAQQQFDKLITQQILNNQDITIIQQLIAQDPRPAYRQKEIYCLFFMQYKQVDIEFFMNEKNELIINQLHFRNSL